jgi:pteridine reductase
MRNHFFPDDGKRKGKTSNVWKTRVIILFMILKGKRALVTGGAVRIGRAITEALQAEGAEVVVHYCASCEDAKALSPFTVQGNLESSEACCRMIDEAGDLDILVNNASLFTRDRLADSVPERVKREFMVNLFAPMELMRLFAAQAKEGAVINLLDRRIRANDSTALPYSITKKGLEELTKLAALDLAPRIRVNAVAPGPILPPPGDSGENFVARAGRVPLEMFPTPGNIAEAVLFLLKAEYCTGQVIYVDGGQHLLGNGVFDQGV